MSKIARVLSDMRVGDLYVSMDGDPSPFWKNKRHQVHVVGPDGSTWQLFPSLLFPAERIHKNYRGGEK